MADLVELVGPLTHRPRTRTGISARSFGRSSSSSSPGARRARSTGACGRRRRRADARGARGVPDEQLRAAGLSAAKLASLRDLTAKVLDGTVVLDASAPSQRRRDRRAARHRARHRPLDGPDVPDVRAAPARRWPVDDLGVRRATGWRGGSTPAPTAEELEPLGDRFRPYRRWSPGTAGRPSPCCAAGSIRASGSARRQLMSVSSWNTTGVPRPVTGSHPVVVLKHAGNPQPPSPVTMLLPAVMSWKSFK